MAWIDERGVASPAAAGRVWEELMRLAEWPDGYRSLGKRARVPGRRTVQLRRLAPLPPTPPLATLWHSLPQALHVHKPGKALTKRLALLHMRAMSSGSRPQAKGSDICSFVCSRLGTHESITTLLKFKLYYKRTKQNARGHSGDGQQLRALHHTGIAAPLL